MSLKVRQMTTSLEGINVKITLELQGWFETTVPIVVNSVTVGGGLELDQYFSSRILSDTDGNGTIEPVQGPNGLLNGRLKVDISGNSVYAEFSGQAQPTGIKIKIENLAPSGAAPGSVQTLGQVNGVNGIYAPTYTAATKTLELNWYMLGFQPGTLMQQTVYYDNLLEDAPVAGNDSYAINVGQTLSGANLLANDTDLDNLGAFGIVDISTVTHINGQPLNASTWINLYGGGQIKVSSNGQLEFREDGDFSDLARGATRTTTFQYTVTDSAGLSDTGDVSITVTGVNSAPTLTVPSTTTTVAENAVATAVSGIAIADADNDTQTVTLSVDHGALSLTTTTGLSFTDADGANGSLAFSGSLANINAALASLKFSPTGNYVGNATLNITTNDGTVSRSGSVSLTVTDVDPVLGLITASVNENSANGTIVTTVTATADTNGLVYSITGGNEAGAFAIDSATGVITVADGSKLDFETLASFALTVAVDDEDADTLADATTTVTIDVLDVNETPTDLSLDNTVISESAASANAVIGFLDATDPDSGETFAFTLVGGAGSADNNSFTISGNSLQAATSLAAGSYNIRVRAADADGLFHEKQLTVTVSDDVKPVISNVTAIDGPLGIGDTLQITIHAGETGLLLDQGTVNGQTITAFTDLGDGTYSAIYTVVENDPSIAAGQDIPVSIRLRDAAGNVSDVYSNGIVNATDTIDSIRPAGSAPSLAAVSDTGISDSDGITANDTPTFTGTGENGVTVELLDASDNLLGTGQVANGVWSIGSGTLAEGTYAVRARYTDVVGNTFESAATSITVDTTAPGVNNDSGSIDLRAAPGTITNVLANDTGAAIIHSVAGSGGNVGTPVAGSNGGLFTIAANGAVTFNPGNDFQALKSGETAQTTLDFMVGDAAGNTTASSLGVTVTGKNDAPVLSANNGASVTVGSTVTISAAALRATDADDAADGLTFTIDSLPANGTLRLGTVVLQAGDTFTQDDIDQGLLNYVAAGSGGQQSFSFSVADGGEDAAAGIASTVFLLNVANAPVTPTQPTGPTTTTEVIGGVSVTTETTTAADGSTTHVVTIPVVTGSGTEPVQIPVVRDSNGGSILAVDIPSGVGITVSGSAAPVTGAASTNLFIAQLGEHGGDSLPASLQEGGKQYIENLPANTPVVVQTLVPVLAPGAGTPENPIVISGSATEGGAVTVLVIDTKNLPSGTVIELKNVSFAAVVGDVRITGGEGSQTVYADGGNQYIVLGPDDDELHGGPGDDTIGSAGGNDRLFGDEGNDTLFGGPGDDFISGGDGEDRALYEGAFNTVNIHRNAAGQLIVTGPEGTDTLESIEHIVFSDGTVSLRPLIAGSQEDVLYKLYQAAFGRFADDGGLGYWNSELTSHGDLARIARSFLESDEFTRRSGSNKDLSDHDFMVQLYARTFNRTPDSEGLDYWKSELAKGVGRENIALAFAASEENSALMGSTGEQPVWFL